jgi:hypothetical protein
MTDAPSGTPNYPSNSKKKKEAEAAKSEDRKPRMEKRIEGVPIERKKPLGQRIMAAFTGDDSRTVGKFILFEVVLPSVKQLISDVVTNSTERFLFGGDTRRSPSRPGYTAYNRVSTQRRDEPRSISQRARATHDFSEVVLTDRRDADAVIEDLNAAIEQYGMATVSDFYDLVGITGSFQDDKWGWRDLHGARVRRVSNGYLIELPRTEAVE